MAAKTLKQIVLTDPLPIGAALSWVWPPRL
jgi:hypothetical protein